VIMFYHVIEHLQNPVEILNILHKLIKHNGVLIVGTPNIGSLASIIFKGNFRLYGPGHLCLFNPKSISKVLSESGFRIFHREYPFLKTDYATIKNFTRMFNLNQISPPFYGNLMTVYARKK
jgi:2-polyprenyl-3-methyl-5-hydroxy-6-metoxy-1,4-benzoquinol methylase